MLNVLCSQCAENSCYFELYYLKDKIQHVIRLKFSASFSNHFLTEVVLVLNINETVIGSVGITILLTITLIYFAYSDLFS